MANNNMTAIEITDTHIKIFHGIFKGRFPVVDLCEVRSIPQKDDAQIIHTLRQIIRAHKKTKLTRVIAAIPRRFAILRTISLPSHSDREIEKMIRLKIAQQIPYPKEDVVLDYQVIRKELSGYSKILVTVVHKDVLTRYLKIFRDSQLHVEYLTLSSVGVANWFFFQEAKIGKREKETTAVINVDSIDTEICFCQEDHLLFARGIPFGAKDLHVDHIENFAEQIGLTIMTYIKEKLGEEIKKVILVSNAEEIILLREKLENEYHISVDIMNPFENVARKGNLNFPLILNQENVSAVVGLGLLMGAKKGLINLVPPDIADSRKNKKHRLEIMKFSLLLFVTVLLSIGALRVNLYERSSYLLLIDREIEDLKPKVRRLQDKYNRMEFIRQRLNPGLTIVDVIYELYGLTPTEVSYNLLQLSDQGQMILQGTSQQSSSINALQSNLINSPLFEEVTVQSVTKRKVFRGELTDFKITCEILRKE